MSESRLKDSLCVLLDTARKEGFDAGVKSADLKFRKELAEAREMSYQAGVALGTREHVNGEPLRHPNHEKGCVDSAYRDLRTLFNELKAKDWYDTLVFVVQGNYRKGCVHMANIVSRATEEGFKD
jgi:hypothetical protein